MKILIISSLLLANLSFAKSTLNNKICVAAIHGAETKFYKKNKLYSSKLSELSQYIQINYPKEMKIALYGFKNNFVAIVMFKDEFWVVNDHKQMIRSKLN